MQTHMIYIRAGGQATGQRANDPTNHQSPKRSDI